MLSAGVLITSDPQQVSQLMIADQQKIFHLIAISGGFQVYFMPLEA